MIRTANCAAISVGAAAAAAVEPITPTEPRMRKQKEQKEKRGRAPHGSVATWQKAQQDAVKQAALKAKQVTQRRYRHGSANVAKKQKAKLVSQHVSQSSGDRWCSNWEKNGDSGVKVWPR